MAKSSGLTEKGQTILRSALVWADVNTSKVKISDIVNSTGFSKQQVIGSLRGLYHAKNGYMAKTGEKDLVLITEKGWNYFKDEGKVTVDNEPEHDTEDFINDEELLTMQGQ